MEISCKAPNLEAKAARRRNAMVARYFRNYFITEPLPMNDPLPEGTIP